MSAKAFLCDLRARGLSDRRKGPIRNNDSPLDIYAPDKPAKRPPEPQHFQTPSQKTTIELVTETRAQAFLCVLRLGGRSARWKPNASTTTAVGAYTCMGRVCEC